MNTTTLKLSLIDIEDAPCGILVFDGDLRIRGMNKTLADILGLVLADVPGMPFDRLLTSANRLMFHIQILTVLHINQRVEEVSINLADVNGINIPFLFNAVQRTSDDAILTECILIRVNERNRLENELFKIKKATEQLPGAVFQFLFRADGSSCFPYASEGIRHVFGVSPLQVLTDASIAFKRIHPEDSDRIVNGIAESSKTLSNWDQQYKVNLPRRGTRWLEAQATPEERSDGSVLWHGYISDITERKTLEAALAFEHERTLVTLNSIGDAVITTNQFEKIVFINPVAENMTGWIQAEAVGQPVISVFNIVNQRTRLSEKSPIAQCIQDRAIVALARETTLISKGGVEYPVEYSAAPIFSSRETIAGVVMVFRDVSGQRRLIQEVEHRASHDHLTGLFNRVEFDRVIKEMLHSSQAKGTVHSLCCIDLDQFKIVNDNCGHAAGDVLLKQIAELLLKSVRAKDTVVRLGGDEFALLLDGCDIISAQRIAQTICDRVAEIRFKHDGKLFRIGASIGIAQIDQHCDGVQNIQLAADGACFSAKNAGRGRVHIFEANNKAMLARHDQLQWSDRLQEAIENNRFELFAQPIMPLRENSAPGLYFEVLLRMRDTDGSLIPPGAFIPEAERYGVIAKIDRWVISRVSAWMKLQHDINVRINTIVINLSGKSVGDRAFQRFVTELLDHGQIAPDKLCFEIAEASTIEHIGEALEFFNVLRQRGLRISLDNFGGGVSSMADLKFLPVDYLKIDRRFVNNIAADPVDFAMVRSINEISHLTGKLTIAEFVESESVLTLLRELGVDFAQGFHIGKPLPIDQIFQWTPK